MMSNARPSLRHPIGLQVCMRGAGRATLRGRDEGARITAGRLLFRTCAGDPAPAKNARDGAHLRGCAASLAAIAMR
jgi:hypothetical protein